MSRQFTRLGSLLLLVATTGCSALGTNHTGITAITPTSYVSKHPESRVVHSHFETVRAQSLDGSVTTVPGR